MVYPEGVTPVGKRGDKKEGEGWGGVKGEKREGVERRERGKKKRDVGRGENTRKSKVEERRESRR